MSTTAEQTLAQWQALYEKLTARSDAPGLARPEQAANRTGLALMQALIAGEIPVPPIARTLDFTLAEVAEGRAVFLGRPHFAHYNPLGMVHGGWIATLLDSSVGCAVHTTLPVNKRYTTLELKVNYVKAVSDKLPMLRAVGQVVHRGARVATAEGRLEGPDGTLFAHATTTCLIFD